MEGLYFAKETNNYYHVGEKTCDFCKTKASPMVFFRYWFFSNKLFGTEYSCKECVTKLKTNHHNKEEVMGFAVITDNKERLPEKSYPIFTLHVDLQETNIKTTDIDRIDSERTADKTMFSNRESLEGAQIGDRSYIKHKAKENRYLKNEAAFDKTLKIITSGKPLIESKEKKQIEG